MIVREYKQYKVSSCGRVWGPQKKTELNLYASKLGYKSFGLSTPGQKPRTRQVHDLVARLFVVNPRPDIFDQVDHIDHNTGRNHWSNLRWVNRSLNNLNSGKCAYKDKAKKLVRPWMAYAPLNGRKKYFGYFDTLEDASRVGKAAQKVEFKRIYQELTGCDSCGIGPKWFKANSQKGRVDVLKNGSNNASDRTEKLQ